YVIVKKKTSQQDSKNPRMTNEVLFMDREKKLFEKPVSHTSTIQNNLSQRMAMADREISGTVTEQGKDEGLPGVNIMIKGTSSGTTSDANGNFNLNIPDGSVTLVFSFVG